MVARPTGTAKVTLGTDDIDEIVLAEFAVRLLAYVRLRAKWMFRWLGADGGDIALGQHCEDIVQESLASLFSRDEKSSQSNIMDPYDHLISTANSKLINLKTKLARRATYGEEFVHDGSLAETTAGGWSTPEESAALKELHDGILNVIIEDAQLIAIYDIAFKDGDLSPGRVAEQMKIPVREVDNLKKRLRRSVIEVLRTQELGAGEGRK